MKVSYFKWEEPRKFKKQLARFRLQITNHTKQPGLKVLTTFSVWPSPALHRFFFSLLSYHCSFWASISFRLCSAPPLQDLPTPNPYPQPLTSLILLPTTHRHRDPGGWWARPGAAWRAEWRGLWRRGKETEPLQSAGGYTEGDCLACYLQTWSDTAWVLRSILGSVTARKGENEERNQSWDERAENGVRSTRMVQFEDKVVKVLTSLQIFYAETGDHQEDKRIEEINC